jgi:hypothetical protein
MEHFELSRMADEGCPHHHAADEPMPGTLDPFPPAILEAGDHLPVMLLCRHEAAVNESIPLEHIEVYQDPGGVRTVVLYFRGQGAAVLKLSADSCRRLAGRLNI